MIGVFAVLQSNGQSKLYVEALYDYEATQDGDLGFRLGDKIEIIKDCKWELAASVHCVLHITSHAVHTQEQSGSVCAALVF